MIFNTFLWFAVMEALVNAVPRGQPCRHVGKGVKGVCVGLTQCPTQVQNPGDIEANQCDAPNICCPAADGNPCYLPRLNVVGTCQHIRVCPSEFRLAEQRKPHFIEVCDEKPTIKHPYVCCPPQAPGATVTIQANSSINTKPPGPDAVKPTLRSKFIATQMCNAYANCVCVYEGDPTLSVGEATAMRVNKCQIDPGLQALIVGGVETREGEFPHQALVGLSSPDDPADISYDCGGSLISEKFVLTAAHCLANRNKVASWVRLGTVNRNVTGTLVAVVRRIRHERYNGLDNLHDIALLELKTPVSFDELIRPACLNVEPVEFGINVTATGFGLDSLGELTNSQMKVQLTTVGPDDCAEPSNTDFVRQDLQICANGNRTTNGTERDTCQGDSGGPLQVLRKNPYCMHHVVGVVSFGETNCGGRGVYVRVSSYIDWIVQKVWPQGLPPNLQNTCGPPEGGPIVGKCEETPKFSKPAK